MRQVLPRSSPELSDADLHGLYGDEPADFLRVNFVASVDGAATVDDRSGGLGSPADTRLFGLLRTRADAVLVGAGTARAEGYGPLTATPEALAQRRARGQRPAPALVLVSRALDLAPVDPLITGGSEPTVILTCAAADARRRERLSAVTPVLVAGADTVDLAKARRQLAARGLRRILCEGGPTLFSATLAARVVDELCLTTAPLLVGPGPPRIAVGSESPGSALRLRHLLEDEGYLFARYAVLPSPVGPG